jgi:hypothetical protein
LRNDVRDVQVVANRVWSAGTAGLDLDGLVAETRGLLVANNTVFKCAVACALRADAARGQDIQFRNNLLLSEGPDLVFFAGGDRPSVPLRPQDGKALHKAWRMDHNWREGRPPTGTDPFSRGWAPPAEGDVLRPAIEDVERNPADLDAFLRPAMKSPLATSGAGQTDPWLPSYVGALPPEGVEPWDWDRTWKAPPPGVLLTVSKELSGGGTFRSITEALTAKELKPGATIRVLDAATYSERIILDNPEKHRGLCLDAPKHAVIELTGSPRGTLVIKDVPDVRIQGFHFRESTEAKVVFPPVAVVGQTPGVLLDDLDILTAAAVPGIFIQKPIGSSDEEPAVVRRCSIQSGNEGIFLVGPIRSDQPPSGGIAIRDNRVWGAIRGIGLQGALSRVHVTGNLVWDCPGAALTLENLREDSDRILIVNNTAFSSGSALRIWDHPPFPKHRAGQVELCNNLLLGTTGEDVGFFLGSNESQEPGDGASLVRRWRFHHNWRDLSGQQSRMAVPLAATDRKLDDAGSKELSRKPDAPDFLRPGNSSPLATAGAGERDGSLPTYVGAVPPRSVRPWDWDRTWRSRAGRGRSEKERDKP